MIKPKTVRVERKSLGLVVGQSRTGSELGLHIAAGLGLVIGDRHLPAADGYARLAAFPGRVATEARASFGQSLAQFSLLGGTQTVDPGRHQRGDQAAGRSAEPRRLQGLVDRYGSPAKKILGHGSCCATQSGGPLRVTGGEQAQGSRRAAQRSARRVGKRAPPSQGMIHDHLTHRAVRCAKTGQPGDLPAHQARRRLQAGGVGQGRHSDASGSDPAQGQGGGDQQAGAGSRNPACRPGVGVQPPVLRILSLGRGHPLLVAAHEVTSVDHPAGGGESRPQMISEAEGEGVAGAPGPGGQAGDQGLSGLSGDRRRRRLGLRRPRACDGDGGLPATGRRGRSPSALLHQGLGARQGHRHGCRHGHGGAGPDRGLEELMTQGAGLRPHPCGHRLGALTHPVGDIVQGV